jgi:hypothetical protein
VDACYYQDVGKEPTPNTFISLLICYAEQGDEINLSILDKVKLIDTLDSDEKNCLLKMIDIAIAKKKNER